MSTASNSLFSTLRQPAFRGLWAGSAIYFTGNAMQVMAASWLMVELTGSSFLAALVMSATIYYLLASMGVVGIGPSALVGLTIGVGLICVSLLVNNLFQQRHYTLTVIDGGHWALALTIEAVVVSLLA